MKEGVDTKKGGKYFKSAITVALLLLSFVIVIFACIKLNEALNRQRIENVLVYTWFNEELLSYDETAELVFDRNNTATELKIDGKKQEIETTPYFYNNERKVLFPQEMSLVQPRLNNGQQNRVPGLSFIDGVSITPRISFANFERELGSAFLFDGSDLYFFVNPVKMIIGDEEMELPVFSFATYNFNHELYVYNYDESTAKYYENVDSVKAEAETYTIDLVTDTYNINGKSRLLVQNVGALDLLK